MPAVDSETETETQTDEAAAETLLGVDAESELESRDDGAAVVATGIVIDQTTEVFSKVSCHSVSIVMMMMMMLLMATVLLPGSDYCGGT